MAPPTPITTQMLLLMIRNHVVTDTFTDWITPSKDLAPYYSLWHFPYTGYLKVQLLPPARKLGQGYVFTGVCHSVNEGGCLPQCMLGYTPLEQTRPPGADTPQSRPSPQSRHAPHAPQSRHPPGADTPPEQTTPHSRYPHSRHAPWEQTPQADTPQSRHPLGLSTSPRD